LASALLGVVFLRGASPPAGRGAWGYAAVARARRGWRQLAWGTGQMYVQSLPPGLPAVCGAPLAVLLKFTPRGQVIRKVLNRRSGEGGRGQLAVLGLAMPAWVLIGRSSPGG